MAHDRNITYTFVNNLAYDLVTDGKFRAWGSSSSGGFASGSPVMRIKSMTTHLAFMAWGADDTATGVDGAVDYWVVSAGASLGPNNSNAKAILQLYFEVPYTGSNAHSAHFDWSQGTMSSSGWSSSAESVNMLLTFNANQAAAANP